MDISKVIEVATIAVDEAKILGIKAPITLLFQSRLVKNLPKNIIVLHDQSFCFAY